MFRRKSPKVFQKKNKGQGEVFISFAMTQYILKLRNFACKYHRLLYSKGD